MGTKPGRLSMRAQHSGCRVCTRDLTTVEIYDKTSAVSIRCIGAHRNLNSVRRNNATHLKRTRPVVCGHKQLRGHVSYQKARHRTVTLGSTSNHVDRHFLMMRETQPGIDTHR